MKIKLVVMTLGALIALTGVWYVALWSPQGGKLEDAREEEAAAKAEADALEVRLNRLENLAANKAQLDADRDRFAALIPDADELDTFILDIHARAQQSGIQFVSIAPTQPADDVLAAGGPVPVQLSMQATGDYFALLRFLEQMRDGDRLVTVEGFTLGKSGEGNSLNAAITARMFIRSGTPVPAPADAATNTGGA